MQEIDEELARRLCLLTTEFYAANAASFSQTRQAPWEGWRRLLSTVPLPASGSLNVLDIACGNLRFERYLSDELLGRRLSCVVVDNSKDLVLSALSSDQLSPNPAFCEINFQSFDICEALSNDALPQKLAAPESFADLSVSFGFMHHIPRFDWRVRLLRAMAAKTKPSGYVVVSCWCFMDDTRLAAKAREITPAACKRLGISALPENDYFLGWQDSTVPVRYCHHFTEAELDDLAAALVGDFTLVARFRADGKNVPLNTYLVFQKPAY